MHTLPCGADRHDGHSQDGTGASPALRVSGRGEGVDQRQVGLARTQQGPHPVVGEVGEPERGAFDPSDEVAADL